MTELDKMLDRMIAGVRELNARFTEEGQRTERRRQIMLQESRAANTPDHMNHTQLVATEPEKP